MLKEWENFVLLEFSNLVSNAEDFVVNLNKTNTAQITTQIVYRTHLFSRFPLSR